VTMYQSPCVAESSIDVGDANRHWPCRAVIHGHLPALEAARRPSLDNSSVHSAGSRRHVFRDPARGRGCPLGGGHLIEILVEVAELLALVVDVDPHEIPDREHGE
jgi:hypothetical protein